MRLLAIGHVTRDEFSGDPQWRLGGAALYASAAAARLGAQTTLVTRVGRGEADALRERCRALGIALHALPAEVTTTFVIGSVAERRQLRLRARARGIALAEVPPQARAADAVVLASVAHEIDRSLLGAFPSACVVVAAQGYVREWSADGTVRERRWDDAAEVVASARAVVVSEDDVAGDLCEPRRWSAHGTVVVTLAERGALVLAGGTEREVAALRAARVADPTGAGDAFAAGLALALAEGRDLPDAVRFANAVASFAVEGVGTDGLARRAAVEARLRG